MNGCWLGHAEVSLAFTFRARSPEPNRSESFDKPVATLTAPGGCSVPSVSARAA
jgi:hypothetical protein